VIFTFRPRPRLFPAPHRRRLGHGDGHAARRVLVERGTYLLRYHYLIPAAALAGGCASSNKRAASNGGSDNKYDYSAHWRYLTPALRDALLCRCQLPQITLA
jgi:hypothetical protein